MRLPTSHPLRLADRAIAQLEADLKLELNAVAMYNKAVRAARDAGDDISAELFKILLADEERHVDWLEAQHQQIKDMGYELYLASQVGGPAAE